MAQPSDNPDIISDQNFKLGGLIVDPSRNILKAGDDSFNIEPRIMDVLRLLAKHGGDVVSRDTLIDTVWNVEFGADESLTRAISVLRKTFRTAGEPDGHIETIPKRGYRLANRVSFESTSATVKPVSQKITPALTSQALPVSSHQHAKGLQKRALNTFAVLFLVASVFFAIKIFDEPMGKQLATGKGRSVAILSFTDMSPAKDHEHFSDGITEEIFSTLADIPNLRIAARNSSFAYKGRAIDTRLIGDELDVSHIIDGSIRTQGERIRVTTQLINTSDGLHVWSKSYDGSSNDVFGLQEAVSQDIVSELQLVLSIGISDVIPIDIEDTGSQSN